LALDRLDVVHAAAIPMRAEPTATWPARLVEQVGTRGLDVHNHPKLHIDEIVIGVGEKARSAHRPCPLGGRIRRRDELRHDLARRAKGSVIEGCKILFHRAACVFARASARSGSGSELTTR